MFLVKNSNTQGEEKLELLSRLTHVNLDSRRITEIGSCSDYSFVLKNIFRAQLCLLLRFFDLLAGNLRFCPNLTTLYLNDNAITSLKVGTIVRITMGRK